MHTSIKSLVTAAILAASLHPLSSVSQIVAQNYGSLGEAGNGIHTGGVILDVPGAIGGGAGGDVAVSYSGGERTIIPFNSALNPGVASPFTIELWVFPIVGDNDDTPLSNRFADGNRSGWTFFQRPESTGWNFRMYNGNGSALGWDLEGGTSTLGTWNHLVATWNGTSAALYVNGVLADDTNGAGANGVYNPKTALNFPDFSIGANFDGSSPSTASVDEVAFYGVALSPAQIANHYALAAGAEPDTYQNELLADGAILYLPYIPEPSAALSIVVAAGLLLHRRKRR